MTANGFHIILRMCLALVIVMQSLTPAAFAIAQQSGHDVSAFICNPSNQAPSAKAQSEIEALVTLLSERNSNEPAQETAEHCSNCVINFSFLLSAPDITLISADFTFTAALYFESHLSSSLSARGPPLGGRAPPIFL